jgi:hypothetical protein
MSSSKHGSCWIREWYSFSREDLLETEPILARRKVHQGYDVSACSETGEVSRPESRLRAKVWRVTRTTASIDRTHCAVTRSSLWAKSTCSVESKVLRQFEQRRVKRGFASRISATCEKSVAARERVGL